MNFTELHAGICAGTVTPDQIQASRDCAKISPAEAQALLIQLASCAPPAVPPTPVDVLSCGGGPPVTVTAPLVALAGAVNPIPVCIVSNTPHADFEVGCSSIDGRTIILLTEIDVQQVLTATLLEADGVTVVTDGSQFVKCDGEDYETAQACYVDALGNRTTQFIIIQPKSGTTTVVWTDALTGAVIPGPPPGSVPCGTPKQDRNLEGCNGTTFVAPVDQVVSIAGVEAPIPVCIQLPLKQTLPALGCDGITSGVEADMSVQISGTSAQIPVCVKAYPDKQLLQVIDCNGGAQFLPADMGVVLQGASNPIPVCFSDSVLNIVTRCGGSTANIQAVPMVIAGTTQPLPVCLPAPAVASAGVFKTCNDVPSAEFLGPNLLLNGDFESSTGTGVSSDLGLSPVLTGSFGLPSDDVTLAPNSWALAEGSISQVTGGLGNALLETKALVIGSPQSASDEVAWSVRLEQGKSYRFTGKIGYLTEFATVALITGADPFTPLVVFTAPAFEDFMEEQAYTFLWPNPTVATQVKFAYSGYNTTSVLIIDSFEIRELLPANPGLATPVDYTSTSLAVIDQVVQTSGCNDGRRDSLLSHIATILPSLAPAEVVPPTAPPPLSAGGVSIADGAYAAAFGPDGTSWSNPGNLRSVSILCRKGDPNTAIPGSPDTVLIEGSPKFVLMPGESVSFNAEDLNTMTLNTVTASGDAAALITFTTL